MIPAFLAMLVLVPPSRVGAEDAAELVLPVRFHLTEGAVMNVKGQQMDVWVRPADVTGPVMAEVNRIWKQAAIRFEVERAAVVPLLRPADFAERVRRIEESSREAEQAGGSRERTRIIESLLDPEAAHPRAFNVHLLPYIGRTYQGFARMEGTLAVVAVWTDKASGGRKPPVRTLLVEPEPLKVGSLARTIAHELGHNLGLRHPDRGEMTPKGRLMGGSIHGYHLTPEEIEMARRLARRHLAGWAGSSPGS